MENTITFAEHIREINPDKTSSTTFLITDVISTTLIVCACFGSAPVLKKK